MNAATPDASGATSATMFALLPTALTVFLANAAMLVLQLLAGRYLAPFVGSSVETWTSVIGAFLTGIALGNWFGGSLADRSPEPRTLSILLFLGALGALLMPALAVLGDSTRLFSVVPLGLRIPLVTAIFCLVPAFVLATITPLIIKLSLRDVRLAGSVSGVTFALSTLGCLVGNYLTGFVLMASLRLDTISYAVAALLAVLALLPLIPGVFPSGNAIEGNSPTRSPVREREKDWLDWAGNIRYGYAIVFLCSFCGMTLELTGSRILAPIVGVSIYTWTGIIGVMLAGTATGNYLGGILADRGVSAALRRFATVIAPMVGFAVAWPLLRAYDPEWADDLGDSGAWSVRGIGLTLGLAASIAGIVLSRWHLGRAANWSAIGAVLGAVLTVPVLKRVGGLFVSKGSFDPWFLTLRNAIGDPLEPLEPRVLMLHAIGAAIGAGIGSLMYLMGREVRVGRKPGPMGSSVLSVTLFLASLFCLVVVVLLGNLRNAEFLEDLELVERVLAWTFALFYLPMTFLGMISPQVIRLSVPSTASAGKTIGRIYAVSTLGAIVGTFAACYLLIQWIGTFRTILLCAVVLSMLALAVGRLWANNLLLYGWSIVTGGAIFGMLIIGEAGEKYDLETRYYAIRVTEFVDEGTQKRASKLVLDQLTHSIVLSGEPTWLHYRHEYVQGEVVGLARLRHPDDTDILIVGGGGYTFPRFVETVMPDVKVEVVEIDPGVTRIAHRKLELPDDTSIVTHNMDGRQFVGERAAKGRYRAAIQDAVNDLSVPYHLLTREYNEGVRKILTRDGAYLLTFIDSLPSGRLWRAAAVTMRETFPHVYLLAPEAAWDYEGRQVCILYGSAEPIDLGGLQEAHARLGLKDPRSAEGKLLDFHTRVMPTDIFEDYLKNIREIDGTIVPWKPPLLTDQYAPVDNLMSGIFRERKRR